MLKTRVMPTLLWKESNLVKGEGFNSWRAIGGAMQAVKVFNLREVDELVFLDVAATLAGEAPDFELIDELANECFMPLTVGGGVRDGEDVRHLLQVGADKVAIGSAALDNPAMLEPLARRFGAQCIVASIDFRCTADGNAQVWAGSGTRNTGLNVIEWAREVERRGAGEILLTSIERDGTLQGYDVEVTRQVCAAVSIPVIASGGAGSYADMAQVLHAGAAAVAAGAIFQFTQATPLGAKHIFGRTGLRHAKLISANANIYESTHFIRKTKILTRPKDWNRCGAVTSATLTLNATRPAGQGREAFWRRIVQHCSPQSVLEVGCNVGANLRPLSQLMPPRALFGIDINATALAQLRTEAPHLNALWSSARDLPFKDEFFDLTFTMGVLIHQPETSLLQVMSEVVRCSRRYVLCGEYFAESTLEVPYREQTGALFKRPYGALYQANFPNLKLVDEGFMGQDQGWGRSNVLAV